MLILLPFANIIVLGIALMGRRVAMPARRRWPSCFLLASSLTGAWLVVLSEGLGLFDGLNQPAIALGWLVPLTGVLTAAIRSGALAGGLRLMRADLRRLVLADWLIAAGGAIVLGLALVVAWLSPPNNPDSLTYHMPRVVHWAQSGSLRHYPAAHLGQNVRPYWAEAAILHLRLLFGSDRPANLVQWSSLAGLLIAVTGIAASLGGGRRAHWISAVFTLSIPMALLQSGTTQNDLVSAFWVLTLAFFALGSSRESALPDRLGAWLALALGMLTKGTFFPYAGPLILLFLGLRWRRAGWRGLLAEGLILAAVVGVLNSPFWYRNLRTFGGPYGSKIPVRLVSSSVPADEASENLGQLSGAAREGRLPFLTSAGEFLAERAAKLARMLGVQFVTPFDAVNSKYFQLLEKWPAIFHAPYLGKLKTALWNHEDTAGSPIHTAVAWVSLLTLALLPRRGARWPTTAYALAAIIGILMVSLIGYSDKIFSVRYQLPFLALGAAAFGVLAERFVGEAGMVLIVGGLLTYALPYVAFSNMRPLVGWEPWTTRVGSVFTEDREKLLFAIAPGVRDEYQMVARQIQDADCQEVGLAFGSRDLEYTFWWLLEAPQSGIHLESLVAPPELRRYLDPTYDPCAVICTECDSLSSRETWDNWFDYGHVELGLRGGK